MAEILAIRLDRLFADTDLEQALDNGRKAFEKDAALLAGFSWPVVRSALADALRGEAKFDLLDWLARGWDAARELHALKDSPAGSPGVAKFGKRKVSGAIHPVVTLAFASFPPVELRFTVDVDAEFAAVTVKVAEGHIVECGCGTCALTAQLLYGESALCDPQQLAPIELPLRHIFGTPIAIP